MDNALSESRRETALLEAQARAEALFDEVSRSQIIRPHALESEVNEAVHALASERFGIAKHWHKRIVRAGLNTLEPYKENPPDRRIDEDDIVFLDLGPVFGEWEADFGRTYVIGTDPDKQRLGSDVATVFHSGKKYFQEHPEVTGAELFAHVELLTREAGWEVGISHAGHLIGEFPHQKIADDKALSYIHPANIMPLRRLDLFGRRCHWILEIHLVHREKQIGAFFEELVSI